MAINKVFESFENGNNEGECAFQCNRYVNNRNIQNFSWFVMYTYPFSCQCSLGHFWQKPTGSGQKYYSSVNGFEATKAAFPGVHYRQQNVSYGTTQSPCTSKFDLPSIEYVSRNNSNLGNIRIKEIVSNVDDLNVCANFCKYGFETEYRFFMIYYPESGAASSCQCFNYNNHNESWENNTFYHSPGSLVGMSS